MVGFFEEEELMNLVSKQWAATQCKATDHVNNLLVSFLLYNIIINWYCKNIVSLLIYINYII